MIRCAIVDDEEMSRQTLALLVEQVDDLSVVAVCENALDASRMLRTQPVDLLFLDVEMPGMTGIELIRSLTRKPEIVLVTGKEEYAVEAFEYDVADYIVKPVTVERFLKAVDRAVGRLRTDVEAPLQDDSVFVKVDSRFVKVELRDVQWVEAAGDYVTIVTENDRFTIHSTMKSMENMLPADRFLRVHRSHIVRVDKIRSLEETTIVIGKKLLPVGDSYRAALRDRLTLL